MICTVPSFRYKVALFNDDDLKEPGRISFRNWHILERHKAAFLIGGIFQRVQCAHKENLTPATL